MNCQEVHNNLSLYLYGELDFAAEAELEQHLSECAQCEHALGREKAWHSAVKSEQIDVPLDLLAQCRQELAEAIPRRGKQSKFALLDRFRFAGPFGLAVSGWSLGIAAASLLVLVGFTAGRWVDRHGVPGIRSGISEASLFDPTTERIRDIQPSDNDRVRIVVDQMKEQAITGRLDDRGVRRWLLVAAKDPTDPAIRVDSVELLKNQSGNDVRDALLDCVRNDPNAGVRLKALDGLRQFRDDPATQETVKFVLEHDYDPGVRSEAIDVLVPYREKTNFSPELADILEQIVRSGQADDYVHMRCVHTLREMKASTDVY